jgi:2-desacetyl-2-hydroxyethyl bacteriochlorophyllide A dehydrogenase
MDLKRKGRQVARALIGSRLTRRYLWARWAMSRSSAVATRKRLYRRTNVEWDMPGHARLVYTDIVGPGKGEVIVRTIASAISPGTERAGFRSETKAAKFPSLPGYSVAGEILALGPGVKELAVGDMVATQAPHASLVVRPANMVFRLGPNTDPNHAALLYPGMIALQGIWRGDLEPGEKVAIFGRGTIGQLAVLLARALGASTVTSVARSRARLNESVRAAADVIVATAEGDRPDAGGYDLVIEASGDPEAIADAVTAVRSGGRVVLLGSPRRAVRFDFSQLASRRVKLAGAHISTLSRQPRADQRDYRTAATTFLRLVDEGRIELGPLFGEEVNPWEAGLLYRSLSKRGLSNASAVFRWDQLPDGDRGGRIGLMTPPIDDLSRGMTFRRLPIEAG